MRIEDLKDYAVRVSASTLTAKDENDKTRGLVRGIRRFKDAPGRDQFDAATKARKLGIDRADLFQVDMFIANRELVVLKDCRRYETIKRYDGGGKYNDAIDRMQAAGLTVIPVKRIL